MRAMDLIVRQGKALYVALANFSPEAYEGAAAFVRQEKLAPITLFQTPYNILARKAEVDFFTCLSSGGTGCAVFYVLGQGVLSGKYLGGKIPSDSRVANLWTEADKEVGLSELSQKQISRLAALAKERGQTLAQMCIAWVLRHPAVTTAVLGASRVSQIRENVKSLQNLSFSDEECRLINEISPPPRPCREGVSVRE